jgi:hypothetical protein
MSTFLGEDRDETVIYVDPLAGGQHLHKSESITIPYDIRNKKFFYQLSFTSAFTITST